MTTLTSTKTARRARPRYVAVTTLNAELTGWEYLGEADSRKAAQAFCPPNSVSDIYANTRSVNFRVWSKSFAERVIGKTYFAEWACEAEDAA